MSVEVLATEERPERRCGFVSAGAWPVCGLASKRHRRDPVL
ncbi:MAG: hypothetical protein OSB09_03400 [Planctomycetota bacterium]|nr:hypothetical protein [Planctomycetota bacterium]